MKDICVNKPALYMLLQFPRHFIFTLTTNKSQSGLRINFYMLIGTLNPFSHILLAKIRNIYYFQESLCNVPYKGNRNKFQFN